MSYYFRYSVIFLRIKCHWCKCLWIKKAYLKHQLHTHLWKVSICLVWYVFVVFQFMINVYLNRLAAKSNLSADVLVSKLTECSSNWSKPTLQLVHQLWTEHAALLHVHQEVLTMASIGQVCHMILACSVNVAQPLFSVRLLISKLLHS